ncbi:hypothetical protein ACOMHN_013402 [Nucella lapillus]
MGQGVSWGNKIVTKVRGDDDDGDGDDDGDDDDDDGDDDDVDVCVESDNTSMGQGVSWGNKIVTKVTLDKPSGDLPPALDQMATLPQLVGSASTPTPSSKRKEEGNGDITTTTTTITPPGRMLEGGGRRGGGGSEGGGGRMDLSKTSSGYGSVSGSEDDDKGLSPTPSGAPEVVSTLTDVTTTEGQTATLECTLTSQPLPRVVWYRGDTRLADPSHDRFSAHFDVTSGKATLTLRDVSAEHGGKYTCVGTNEWGEASTKATLLVKRELYL